MIPREQRHNQGPQATDVPADDLNARVGVLTRREIEARILAPVIEAMAARFGREEVLETVRDTIVAVAREQGRELATTMRGASLHHFADSLRYWTRDGALEIDLVTKSQGEFCFNVTRCRYAELYRALGISELGEVFSCNRDAALIEGFNPDVTFERTQTIMRGAPYCDFRYVRRDTTDDAGTMPA
jgi:hypothetical protein